MKKILAILLALCMMLAFAACRANNTDETTTAPVGTTEEATIPTVEANFGLEETLPADAELIGGEVEVMTHAEFVAAEADAPVVIEAYVQAAQGWWQDAITIYAQDKDGGYFLYNTVCSEEDSAKIVPGAKIRVTGTKTIWDGLHEIMEGEMEILADAEPYIAEPVDLTEKLGTDELVNYQNVLASFKGLTIEKIEYKNGEPGDDIYVTASLNGNSYDFCVEVYLTGEDSDVYKTVGELKAGDVVDIDGFLYWYADAMNPHITAIVKK